jgi:hypothetical protein
VYKGGLLFVYVYYTMTKGGSSMQRLSDDLILTLITHPITKPTEKKVIPTPPSFTTISFVIIIFYPLIFDDPSSSPWPPWKLRISFGNLFHSTLRSIVHQSSS